MYESVLISMQIACLLKSKNKKQIVKDYQCFLLNFDNKILSSYLLIFTNSFNGQNNSFNLKNCKYYIIVKLYKLIEIINIVSSQK